MTLPIVRIERRYFVQCCGCESELEIDHLDTAAEARAFAKAQGWEPNRYGGWACPEAECREYSAA